MKILILGGTVFLGRAVTDAAIARGHSVTHFHRGRSGPDDARVTTVHGDRANAADLARLGDAFDAVIDTSGYLPQGVAPAVKALARVPRYQFVSTISVYAGPGTDEAAPCLPPPDPLPTERSGEHYGACKALCEEEVRVAFGERATIVRPGLIVGPHDATDRFTWWPERVARGGDVLAPGEPHRPAQVIDVRDLGEWMVRLAEDDRPGTFNATGPVEGSLTMGALLQACKAVSGSDARLRWLDDAALAASGIGAWIEMPLWIPASDPMSQWLLTVPVDRAREAGLRCRPIADTVRDTLAWSRSRGEHAWKAGLAADKEAAALAAHPAG